MSSEIPRLVVITSGDGGSTTEALIHATQAGFLDALVTDIIYNNPPASEHTQNHITARVERLNKQYKKTACIRVETSRRILLITRRILKV